MAGKKIRDLAGGRRKDKGDNLPFIPFNRFDEYFNLLMNSVKITKVTYNQEVFIKRQLFEQGSVGYDRPVDLWAMVAAAGSELNALGNPTKLELFSLNGKSYEKRAYYEPNERGAYKIDVMPAPYSMASMIKNTTDIMYECDLAAVQNLKGSKAPIIIVCRDPDVQLSIQQAIQQQQQGYPVVVVDGEIADGIKTLDMASNLILDQIAMFRDHERDELLNKIGTMTANINKRERVQVGEVDATIGKVVDYAYSIIDTWNRQMETYGLPFEMEFNGSMEDLYADEIAHDPETTENKEENNNDQL